MTDWYFAGYERKGMPVGAVVDSGTNGPVLFDASALSTDLTIGTSITWTNAINIGSGANGTTNRALLAAVCFVANVAGTSSSPSVTFNGAAMTQVAGPLNNGGTIGDVYFFGLVAPATGSHDLVVSWTGTNQVLVPLLSVVAANQTGGTTTFRNAATNSGNSTSADITPTIVSGDMCMAAHLVGTSTNGAFAGLASIGRNDGANAWAMGAEYGDSTTPTLSRGVSSGAWLSAACSIRGA